MFEVNLEYLLELHVRNDDYPLAYKMMSIKPEITGEKQHNLRVQYFSPCFSAKN